MKKSHGLTNSSKGAVKGASAGTATGLTSAETFKASECDPGEAKKQQRPKEMHIKSA